MMLIMIKIMLMMIVLNADTPIFVLNVDMPIFCSYLFLRDMHSQCTQIIHSNSFEFI